MSHEPSNPITIYDLAVYRLGLNRPDSLSGADFEKAGLPILGGCEVCAATVAAYNSCPSETGYIRCLNGCIDDLGFATVEEANQFIFDGEMPNVPA